MRKVILLAGLVFMLFNAAFSSSAEVPQGFSPYEVKEGDLLSKIAPQWAWDTIMRVNRIDAGHLPLGRTILIPTDPAVLAPCPVPSEIRSARGEPRSIHVFLDFQYFGAYEHGKLAFWGPISSGGKNRRTPTGSFRITMKAKKYFSHNRESYGTPMPYAQKLSSTNIFLHQQSLPGKSASHGCIRLLMSDAIRLFSWTNTGDLVVVVS